MYRNKERLIIAYLLLGYLVLGCGGLKQEALRRSLYANKDEHIPLLRARESDRKSCLEVFCRTLCCCCPCGRETIPNATKAQSALPKRGQYVVIRTKQPIETEKDLELYSGIIQSAVRRGNSRFSEEYSDPAISAATSFVSSEKKRLGIHAEQLKGEKEKLKLELTVQQPPTEEDEKVAKKQGEEESVDSVSGEVNVEAISPDTSIISTPKNVILGRDNLGTPSRPGSSNSSVSGTYSVDTSGEENNEITVGVNREYTRGGFRF